MSFRRPPGPIPRVPPPAPFHERRRVLRRAADRQVQQEASFLARSLDIAASGARADERLGRLLALVGHTVGAAQTAIVVDGPERRVIVEVPEGASSARAEALAAWLDAHAPRPRSDRAASSAAPMSIVTAPARGERSRRPIRSPHYALQPLPDGGRTALGFTFRSARMARALPLRLSPPLARHAAATLALATRQVDEGRDLELLRAQDVERRRFVRTVTHELRTPLTSLGGYLDLLLQDPTDERGTRSEFLHRSRDLVDGLGHLVGDLLDLSRLESGQLGLAIGPFSGAEAAQSALEAVMPLSRMRDLSLGSQLPSRLRTVHADRRRVEQILINLLSNAIKFTRPGARVELDLRFEGAVAVYIVRDRGAGIDPTERRRIFEPFYRGAAQGRIVGTGLGLPIARELAQRMGGTLDVTSIEDRGTSFAVGLPATAMTDPELIAGVVARVMIAEEHRLAERGTDLAGIDTDAIARRASEAQRGMRRHSKSASIDGPLAIAE